MKFLFAIILAFMSSFTYAQDKYEAFAVNEKYGVVTITDLSEFIVPSFDNWSELFNTVTLIDGNTYTFIDRKSGQKESYLFMNESLRFNGLYYLLFEKDGKSIFIPKEVSKKVIFNKKYTKAIGNGSDLIAGDGASFDVFVKPNFKTAKLKSISASKVYKGSVFRKRTQKEEDVIVFYGRDTVAVYDSNFKLLKKYPGKEVYESRMLDIISSDFTKVEPIDYRAYAPMTKSFNSKIADGHTIITCENNGEKISVKGGYAVNDVIYGNKSWIQLIDRKAKTEYQFKIDFVNKRFILPQQYIDLLELKFL